MIFLNSSKLIAALTAISNLISPVLCQELQHPLTDSSPSSPLPGLKEQPLLGFGTWNLLTSPENITAAVSIAIQAGYRQIDCAAIYRNEPAVGKGIAEGLKAANITREEIWVTSKLWNDHHGNITRAEEALEKTLSDLGLDYLDLYLMHWPVGISPEDGSTSGDDYVETWISMTSLPKSKARQIGVCNFAPASLTKIIASTGIKPFAHQMEMHPYLPQSAWVATHKALGIKVTAYSPLGNSNPGYNHTFPPPLLGNEDLKEVVKSSGCTAVQVVLKWGMERGTSVIPKSAHEGHITENFKAGKCVLSKKELKKVDALGEKYLTRFLNPSKQWGVQLFEGLEGV